MFFVIIKVRFLKFMITVVGVFFIIVMVLSFFSFAIYFFFSFSFWLIDVRDVTHLPEMRMHLATLGAMISCFRNGTLTM